MKVFIVLFALATIASAFTVKTTQDLNTARTDCFEKTSLPEPMRQKVKTIEYPDETEVHKYVFCACKEMEFCDATHGFITQNMIEQFKTVMPEEKIRGIVQKCITHNEQSFPTEKWMWSDWKCMVDSGLKTPLKAAYNQ